MDFELRQLSVHNGAAEYAMLQEIAPVEYGFTNEVNGMTFDAYKKWLVQQDGYSKSQNLPENWIPQTTYFLYIGEQPVGIARIRHCASPLLEARGVGNFGYGIGASYRGKGYGGVLFQLALQVCKALGYDKITSFVHIDNQASNKIFVNHGAKWLGVFEGVKNIYETAIN